jgi:3-oxoacyl-[acyl-carrier protein] reductase
VRFQGKTALVTGGGGGFGEAICKQFADEGARVVVTDLDQASGERVAAEIEGAGGSARFIRVDVRVSAQVASAVQLAVTDFGGLDIIVNNAGIVHAKQPAAEMDEETFQHVMDVNLKSVFLFNKHGVPALVAAGGGAMINVASTASLKPRSGNVIYGVSKAAVVAFTKGLAIELAAAKIRVNTILPVAARTQMLLDFIGDNADEQIAQIAAMIPLNRLGEPADMAAAITFLASDDAAFITGAVLPVDGGWTAG